MLQTAKIMKKMNRKNGMGRIFLKECILLCLVRLPTSVAFPVGIGYPLARRQPSCTPLGLNIPKACRWQSYKPKRAQIDKQAYHLYSLCFVTPLGFKPKTFRTGI